jgi:enoyl-CoA hydratase/carnithine racemase
VIEEIVTARHRWVGEIRIDRPRALNALNGAMFAEIGRILGTWETDPGVEAVLVRGAGGHFSAGGDIRFVRDLARAGDDDGIRVMYATEYRLNAQIEAYPKPYVAAVDGYCMGGGLGVAMYADVFAVTERAQVAMPEVGIGFFPDVGASYVLPRLRDRIGWYMGLTGARLSAFDAVACGLATHMLDDVAFARVPEIVADGDMALASLRYRFDRNGLGVAGTSRFPRAPIDSLVPAIRRCFGEPDVRSIMAALAHEDGPWAAEALAAMRRASPASLAITFELFRRGSALTLAECLEMEYQLAIRVCKTPEFLEGVRAMVIDKDRTPRWDPPSVEELSDVALEAPWSEIDVGRNELGLAPLP